MEISSISLPSDASIQTNELPNLMNALLESIRNQENNIRADITEGLKPNGKLMGLPDHIREQFKVWDNTFTSGEDRKLVDALKQKIVALVQSNENYIVDQVQSKTSRFQLELAMRAANKATSGIQQILSAQ
jgi:hypothetical protein